MVNTWFYVEVDDIAHGPFFSRDRAEGYLQMWLDRLTVEESDITHEGGVRELNEPLLDDPYGLAKED